MKKIKKLVLNKSVISNLNKSEMSQLKGGYLSQEDPLACGNLTIQPICPSNTCPTEGADCSVVGSTCYDGTCAFTQYAPCL